MSLTRTAYLTRQGVRFGGVGLLVFLVIWYGSVAAISAYKKAHPPYVAPTVRYGILPKMLFPEKSFEAKTFAFEFPNDSIPKFSDQAKVFIVYKPNSSFLALDYYSGIAKKLGFTNAAVEKETGLYEFKNESLNQTLTINVLDGSFKMKYPYEQDQLLLFPESIPDKAGAVAVATSYLGQADKYNTDLENGEKLVSYWKMDSGRLSRAQAQSDAHFARVDLFREEFDSESKIVSAEVESAPISVLISGSNVEGKKVVEVNYQYANIDRESWSTYPIKTADEAIAELSSGKYWPAKDSSTSSVTIRRMYLAYFEPFGLTNYMQPVYVFEGDGGMVAYVSAVSPAYSAN